MCLSTNSKRPKTANKPVTCYKVVWKMPWNTPAVECGHFLSEFTQFPYNLGVEYSIDDPFPSVNTGEYLRIEKGFHSYARLMDAVDGCWEYRYTKSLEGSLKGFYGQVILRCEIPEGAHYWEGNKAINDKGYKEYCSDRIKVTAWRMWDETAWRTDINIEEEQPCA